MANLTKLKPKTTDRIREQPAPVIDPAVFLPLVNVLIAQATREVEEDLRREREEALNRRAS